MLTGREKFQLRQIRRRWQKIICNTEPLDRERTMAAIESAYSWLNYPPPEILFFANPQEIFDFLSAAITPNWAQSRWLKFLRTLWRLFLGIPIAIFYLFWVFFITFSLVYTYSALIAAGIYMLVKLFNNTLLPPAISPIMAAVYQFLLIVGLLAGLGLVIIFGGSMTKIAIDDTDNYIWQKIVNSVGIHPDFLSRYGRPLHEDFRQRFWNLPFADRRANLYSPPYNNFYSPTIYIYANRLHSLNRDYTNRVAEHPFLSKSIRSYFFLPPTRDRLDPSIWLAEVSNIDFYNTYHPDTLPIFPNLHPGGVFTAN
jgi:hypothetical protein